MSGSQAFQVVKGLKGLIHAAPHRGSELMKGFLY